MMAVPRFDHRRILDWDSSSDVALPQSRARLTLLVVDYMKYLRSLPARNMDGDDNGALETEVEVATVFAQMICQDTAWTVARQAAPEFQGEA